MISAYDPLAGVFAFDAVGVTGGVVPALDVAIIVSTLGFEAGATLSAEGFGALSGGAAVRLFTVPVKPGLGFGLVCFSGILTESSSAFRFVPFSGEGRVGKPGRAPGLPASTARRCGFALIGRETGFGGVGAFPLPIELTISPKKLMLMGRGRSQKKQCNYVRCRRVG